MFIMGQSVWDAFVSYEPIKGDNVFFDEEKILLRSVLQDEKWHIISPCNCWRLKALLQALSKNLSV